MLKRTITGTGYVLVMAGFFLLRQLVDPRLFNILIWFLSAVGTFEVARAVKSFSVKNTIYYAVTLGIVCVPLYCVGQYLLNGIGWIFGLSLLALGIIIAVITCLVAKGKSIKTYSFTLLPYLYPYVFIFTTLLANDSARGFIILLLSFVISPFSDTFAYFVGSLFKGPKLCPKLSPKKTWSGAIGGTIGGILGALIVCWIFLPNTYYLSPILVFIIAGVLGSIVNILGDLFESFIKRKVGIKDMGNILPGHGGVMDRIDGTAFVVVLIYLLFLIF